MVFDTIAIMRKSWNPESILRELKALYRKKADLSYNAMCRKHQSLLSAAAYHFGSYKKAVMKAGLDYRNVLRRPQWTRERIISIIRAAHAKKLDLSWSRVTRRTDEVGHAAFASLQPRLFGSWRAALKASRVARERVSRYQAWDALSMVKAIKDRKRKGDALSSGLMQKENPAMHAAALRLFGSWDMALEAASIKPESVRLRRSSER